MRSYYVFALSIVSTALEDTQVRRQQQHKKHVIDDAASTRKII
jgi:hypothetical protein